MFAPLYFIYGIITFLLYWIVMSLLPLYGFIGNVMMTLIVSFIICTPITLLYMILLELKAIKELKIEELRQTQRRIKKSIKTPN